MAEFVTHRLQFRVIGSMGAFTWEVACDTSDRALYFSNEPTCTACRAAPVMATAGAYNVDANGSEVAHG